MEKMADTTQSITQYPVTVWEGIAIALGAIGLVIVALVGLGVKAVRNAVEPQRAEAIAKSLMDYQIPGGSYGVVGINIGGLKAAMVRSSSSGLGHIRDSKQGDYSPPEVELLLTEAPANDQTEDDDSWEISNDNLSSSYEPQSEFKAITSRTEIKLFCGKNISVTIQEGTFTLTNSQFSVPAVRYDARAVFKNTQRSVELTTTGKNAKQKAVAVFNSLKCK